MFGSTDTVQSDQCYVAQGELVPLVTYNWV